MLDAFMAQSAALQGSSANFSGLKQAAAEGKLLLEPGVAEACAKHCEDMIDKLHVHIREVLQMRWGVNMGDCLIGKALGQKFADKGIGSENSIVSLLEQHQQVLAEMAATYRAAGRTFAAQEQSNASALGSA